jgi:hypothetical protein
MNTKVKKVIARELVLLFVAAIIGAIGFFYGYVSKNNHRNELTKMNSLNDSLNAEIDASITDFRKDPFVDSVYKIQMSFFNAYGKLPAKHGSDTSNFFFWKNVLSTISDSTFNFTYANDNVMFQLYQNSESYFILFRHRNKFHAFEEFRSPVNKKFFSSFVQNVQLYNFVSSDKWTSYERLRIEQDKVNSEIPKLELAGYTSSSDGFFIVMGISSVLLFGVRYLFYLVRWVIATLKSS